MTARSAPDPAAAGVRAPEADSSWAALGRGLLEEIAAVARERLRLFALEGQQFALAAGQMLTLGVIAAVFVLTAWFVLVAGLIAGAVQLGVPWAAALAGGVVVNLAAALIAWLAMRRLLSSMMFASTLRRLEFARTTDSRAAGDGSASVPALDESAQASPPPLRPTP